MTHMRHKKLRAIVVIFITKHGQPISINFYSELLSSFPSSVISNIQKLAWIDCLNFKRESEAMIYIISRETFFVRWQCSTPYSAEGLITPTHAMSTITTLSKRKLPISREILTSKDSKKHKGPKNSLRALNCILLGHKHVLRSTDIQTI